MDVDVSETVFWFCDALKYFFNEQKICIFIDNINEVNWKVSKENRPKIDTP
jgi:hypothetical protein